MAVIQTKRLWVQVDELPFTAADLEAAHAVLHVENGASGAEAWFLGRVRAYGDQPAVLGVQLEHYPAMTMRVLQEIAEQAIAQFGLNSLCLRHRVGAIALGEIIVGVIAGSGHRQAALDAVAFVMDALKHAAPFWKQEITPQGAVWVEQKDADQARWASWQTTLAASNLDMSNLDTSKVK